MQTIGYTDWGLIEYGTAWDRQEAIMQQQLQIKQQYQMLPEADRPEGPGTEHFLFFCTHPPVYTLGKSGQEAHLLINEQRLQDLKATFYKTNRGGDITFHGPGQIVGYPILDLEKFFTDLGKYMRALEEVIIRTIARFGLAGGRLPGATGVWLDADQPAKARKICAMGVRCSRWITMHGFALNVNTDLKYFDFIIPCGIGDKGVTSMSKELNSILDEQEVKQALREEFESVFDGKIFVSTDTTALTPTLNS